MIKVEAVCVANERLAQRRTHDALRDQNGIHGAPVKLIDEW